MRIAYVNGEFVPIEEAKVSILDRGFMFADAIYEVAAVVGGRLVDHDAHMARLRRSLGEIALECPVPIEDIAGLQAELVRRNAIDEGTVYLQITRGIGDREFTLPMSGRATMIMVTQAKSLIDVPKAETGIRVVTVPDIRWKRRDIKTVALIAQVLAKQRAKELNADEAWMVEDGCITEGGSSNAFIVTPDRRIVTRRADNSILSGITRKAVMALAAESGVAVDERPFTVEEAYGAAEAFLTSASTFVMPVVEIDDRRIAGGKPGPLSRRLREIYIDFARGTLQKAGAGA